LDLSFCFVRLIVFCLLFLCNAYYRCRIYRTCSIRPSIIFYQVLLRSSRVEPEFSLLLAVTLSTEYNAIATSISEIKMFRLKAYRYRYAASPHCVESESCTYRVESKSNCDGLESESRCLRLEYESESHVKDISQLQEDIFHDAYICNQ